MFILYLISSLTQRVNMGRGCFFSQILRDHSFSTFAKFSEKLTFLTPRYAHVLVHIREILECPKWVIPYHRFHGQIIIVLKTCKKTPLKMFLGLFLISSEVRYMQLYEDPFFFTNWLYAVFSCFIDGEISSHSFLIFICNSFLSKRKKLTF